MAKAESPTFIMISEYGAAHEGVRHTFTEPGAQEPTYVLEINGKGEVAPLVIVPHHTNNLIKAALEADSAVELQLERALSAADTRETGFGIWRLGEN